MASPGESDFRAFISQQLVLLDREKAAEAERSSLLISKCSQTLLEKQGLALGGLGVASVSVGLGGKSLVELERPSAYHPNPVFPPHALRPGDLARIDEHKSGKIVSKAKASNETLKPVEGVVYKVSDTKIVIAVSASERSEDELDLPERCVLVKLANTVTHDRMRRAIEDLEKRLLPGGSSSENTSLPGLNALHRVLLSISPPSPPRKDASNLFFDAALNPSQIRAVKFAVNASEVACIHGPPGTGKTRVLVEIIRQLVYDINKDLDSHQEDGSKPQKILVCGASNLAVDNLVERLSIPPSSPVSYLPEGTLDSSSKSADQKYSSKPLSPILLTRLGHPARVLSSLYNRTLDFQVQNSEETTLVEDVKAEIEQLLGALSGKGPRKSTNAGIGNKRGDKEIPTLKKGQRLKGAARKEAWKDVRELRKEYRKREGGIVKTVLSKAQVVLATCHGAGSRQLQVHEFDVVIIDEATQAMEALCWIPVLKAKKLILAGDPMQLGPTIISEGNRKHKKKKDSKSKTTTAPKPVVTDPVQVNESDTTSDTDVDSDSDNKVEPNSNGVKKTTTENVTKTKDDQKKTTCLLRPPRSLNKTLFNRIEDMYGSKLKLMLDVQYRMNTKIATFPSKVLYHSRLKSDESNRARLLRDLPEVNQGEEFEDVVGEGTEVIFYDTAGAEFWERSENQDTQMVRDDGGSLCNENEAAIVKRWVDKLISAGVKASQISIITPYQAQSQLLSRLIAEPGLEIGTADGMQGRENEAIILSLVRSNAEGEVGFLKEKRRLNVAMTRAKRHLCIVGDSETISRGGGRYLKKWMKWLEKEAEVRFAGDLVN